MRLLVKKKGDELMGNKIWRQCKRKNRYRDEHTANYYKRKCEQSRGTKLDYYWCPYCNGFHLTSMEVPMGGDKTGVC